MSKPIFVASVPRACSTAFERVFMTRPDILRCQHEPFGDAFYYGPERLGYRYDGDETAQTTEREASGFSKTTFRDVMETMLAGKLEQKRLFIKDISYYLIPPMGKIAGIAPSLKELEAQSVDSNNSISGEDTNNPTVIPNSLLRQFQFTFLIRHPSRAIPSYYRCTIPPLSEVTGFDYFDPREAGFRETRILLEHLLNAKILRREDVILIDADDLLNNPDGIVSEYCKRVGIEYNPSMLEWEATKCGAFEKWKGFHEDAMKSGGLKARTKKPLKSDEENIAEWKVCFGEEGAKLVQQTVQDNMADYEWLKAFKMNV
ncbi:P-loop containing nucleoside triphosphate hydrolase protein [Peziza echinospora]|nr:P-loop containing nucleoside triphosphate hydrolase protein [Peziza echinospora]